MSGLASIVKRDGSAPGGVFWITADGDESKVIEALAKLAEKLHGSKMTDEDRRDIQIVVLLLKQEFSKCPGHWLLCMDNVDESGEPSISGILDVVTSFASSLESGGSVVITTRSGKSRLWNRMKAGQRLTLEPLSVEDAVLVLWRFKETIENGKESDERVKVRIEQFEKDDPKEYRALYELCGFDWRFSLAGLPLALVQAGAYIRQFECSFSEYLELYRNSNGKEELNDIVERSEEFAVVREEQRSALTTWKISADRLSTDAIRVFRAFSMLGNAPIPEDLVKRIVQRGDEREFAVERRYRNYVLKELVFGSSLVQKYQDTEQAVFDMHRLVRLFVIVEMDLGSDIWTAAFFQALTSSHSHIKLILGNAGRSFLARPDSHMDIQLSLLPHAFSIVTHFTRSQSSMELTPDLSDKLDDLHFFARQGLDWSGRIQDTVLVSQSQLNLMHRVHGTNSVHREIATALHNLADSYLKQGNLEEALMFSRKALDMVLDIHGDGAHPSISAVYNNLAQIYQAQGNLEEAVLMARECLEMKLAIHGHDANHVSIATSYSNLSVIYQNQGYYIGAVEMAKKSLGMQLAIYDDGAKHPSIATLYSNLSLVYEDQGNLEDAVSMARKSLEMYIAIHGETANHPSIATACNNLSMMYLGQWNLKEAEVLARKCLNMRLAIYGYSASHHSIATSYNNLSQIFQCQGNMQEALATARKSLEMLLAIHGDDGIHPEIASSYNNLSTIHGDCGNLNESAINARKGLDMYRALYGEGANNSKLATSYNNLSMIYRDQGNLEEALGMAQHGLNMFTAVHGENAVHPEIGISYNNLSLILQDQGDLEEAVTMARKGLHMERAIRGEDAIHYSIATSYNNLSRMYRDQGNLVEAIEIARKCLDMLLAIHGEDAIHFAIAASNNTLSRMYWDQGNIDEAIQHAQNSLDIFRRMYEDNAEHPHIVLANRTLHDLLQRLNMG